MGTLWLVIATLMGTYVLQIEAYERMMILCGLKNYQMENSDMRNAI